MGFLNSKWSSKTGTSEYPGGPVRKEPTFSRRPANSSVSCPTCGKSKGIIDGKGGERCKDHGEKLQRQVRDQSPNFEH